MHPFATNTPHHDLPLLAPAQAAKHVTHNEAITALDALVQLSVDAQRSDPPAGPEENTRFLVAPDAMGAWAGHVGKIASWEADGWTFLRPAVGWLAADRARGVVMLCREADANGSPRWDVLGEGVERLGVGTEASDAQRFAVASGSSLFTHAGSDCRVVINRASAGAVGSLILQTGYEGRAEITLTSQDRLAIRTSANGADWTDALVVDPATGAVEVPTSLEAGAITAGGHPVLSEDTSGVARIRRLLVAADDLDAVDQTGLYPQRSNAGASLEANYPVANAGMLSVVADGNMVYQQYHVFSGGGSNANTLHVRGRFYGTWSAWRAL